jgi:HD-like signal output (HDOD) protein
VEIKKKTLLQDAIANISDEEIGSLFEESLNLPPIPAIASELLAILSNPFSDARELAQLVEKDPNLTAQILKFCSSSFSGFRGQIESIQDAINRVLGYEVTCNLVLGLVLAKAVKMDSRGALGAATFWKNALACASAARSIAMISKTEMPIKPGTAYLAGMLHHIGIAVLNVQFPDLFKALNAVKEANPDISLSDIELALYGDRYKVLNHGALGALLLKQWRLPLYLVDVCRNHQNLEYKDDFKELIWCIQLSEELIFKWKFSDDGNKELVDIANRLGIDLGELETLEEKFGLGAEAIDSTAQIMV